MVHVYCAGEEPTGAVLVSGAESGAVVRVCDELAGGPGGLWQVSNKYYRADVRLLTEPPRAARESVHAHLVLAGDAARAAELVTAAGPLPALQVRLLLCDAEPDDELQAWAVRAGYEAVSPLEDEADPRAGAGLARVRAALQAHRWPGLRLSNRDSPPDRYRRAELLAELAGRVRREGGPGAAGGIEERAARADVLLAALCDLLDDE